MIPFELKDTDFLEVSKIIKNGGSGRLFSRAMALKMKHKNYANIEIAELLDITPRTVINICEYYRNAGLEASLNDDPRPGAIVQIDDRVKSQIVALVCSDPPEAFDRWTLELIQDQVIERNIVSKISKEKIRIILHEHDLKPWRYEMWCIPNLDDEFIKRMEDVLDIYEAPVNENIPVVCLDEKPIQLLEDKREPVPMSEGSIKKIDYEYQRNGSVNLFMAIEPKNGIFHARVTENRTGDEFAKYIASLERKYHEATKIILIMDNLNIHKEKSLIEFYGEEEGKRIWSRFEVHHTPKHASWLNQAEIGLAMYSRQCLGNRRINDIQDLRKKTNSWVRAINSRNIIIKWKFTKKDAREKFEY